VHEAILQLMVEEGVQACTFSAVAERAGIERSTLYRRFPDRWDAIIDTLMVRVAAELTPTLGDSFAQDLDSVLRKLRDTMATPLGPAVVAVAAEYRARSAPARPFFDRRMEQLAPMFEAAIARGELPADVDREAVFTLAAGPLYFRMFIAGREVDDEFIHSIVSNLCWLYCTPSAAAKVSLPARIA
jgi:AcrR family transcriptional regulator